MADDFGSEVTRRRHVAPLVEEAIWKAARSSRRALLGTSDPASLCMLYTQLFSDQRVNCASVEQSQKRGVSIQVQRVA